MSPPDSPNPSIEPSTNGPYIVRGIEDLTNSKGQELETRSSRPSR
jgi:hypothetical protein